MFQKQALVFIQKRLFSLATLIHGASCSGPKFILSHLNFTSLISFSFSLSNSDSGQTFFLAETPSPTLLTQFPLK